MGSFAIDHLPAERGDEVDGTLLAGARILALEPVGKRAGIAPLLLDPADDRRAWLNGLPVTESPLAEGDLLRIGPMEFRVREATPTEVLDHLHPADTDPREQSPEQLALRQSRLAAMRARLKEHRKWLSREFEKLQVAQAQFDARRGEFLQSQAAGNHRPASHAAKLKEDDGLDEFIDNYMQDLFRRMRSLEKRRLSDEEAGISQAIEWAGVVDHGPPPPDFSRSRPAEATGDRDAGRQSRPARPRQPSDVDAVRASVATLRDVANRSARAAVAKHATRKTRKRMAAMVRLLAVSSVSAVGLFLIEGCKGEVLSPSFAAMLVGVVAIFELTRGFLKARSHRSNRLRPHGERRLDGNLALSDQSARGSQPGDGD
jgi:hypothetical protein